MKKYKPITLKLHTEKEALAIIAALSNTTNNSLKEELKKEYKEEVEFDDEPYRLWEKLTEQLGFKVHENLEHHFREK